MREHVYRASRRRDERLVRIRKLSLWITGGAAAASLGMGTAFAHAIPGHTMTTGASTPATGTTPATSSSAASGSTAGTSGTTSHQGSSHSARGHHRHRLAPPASAPATPKAAPKPAPAAPPAPVVSSGGS
jgi:hypothetical protein